MPIIGSVLKRALHLRKTLLKLKVSTDAIELQKKTLTKLLGKAKNTAFGKHYHFDEILNSPAIFKKFQEEVPVFDYNKIHKGWWHRTLAEEKNVCWPGSVKYFALSSGTSESASKHIPVTNDMLKAIRKTSLRQLLALAYFNIPDHTLEKGMLMIGGSTDLVPRGSYYEGDLSGISAGNIPFWFQPFYKPGKEIAGEKDWNTKIEKIVRSAKDWDISSVVGVPAWIQLIFEKIIDHYKLNNIHDIWPNLSIYAHGGVSLEPYKHGFAKLLGKPLIYIETYLASEGFIAFQNRPDTNSMQLVLNNGIFLEFIPFNEDNFSPEGQVIDNPKTLLINEVEEGKDYAILLSTCTGAWRYLIGDTIRFTSVKDYEIIITGRTKHFLSLCGEHLSVDNMNQAVSNIATEFNIAVPEFTVVGIPHESLFAHQWYLGTDNPVDAAQLKKRLDEILCELNDDYKVERKSALKEIFVEVLPTSVFYGWMKAKGKMGGQHKFPRVMNKKQFEEWQDFIKQPN
jgi:hypothetical protein